MPWSDYDSETCSIARAMSIIGERWSLLILRDLFQGVRRFDELQRHLKAPRDVLTRRLRTLTDAGVIERVPYQEPGARQRYEYRLTPAGRELRVVLTALRDWGDTNLSGDDGPPVSVDHADCGAPVHAQLVCEQGHVIDSGVRLTTRLLPGAKLAG
jgi:DNA-binding HxlR family transcriptional regulator